MTALTHHFRTRLTALLASPAALGAGVVWFLAVLGEGAMASSAYVASERQWLETYWQDEAWRSQRIEHLEERRDRLPLLLCLFVWGTAGACATRARGRATAAGKRSFALTPHPTLPLVPRRRALTEALTWAPIWVLGAPLAEAMVMLILISLDAFASDGVTETSPESSGVVIFRSIAFLFQAAWAEYRVFGVLTALLVPLITLHGLDPRPHKLGLSWWVLPFAVCGVLATRHPWFDSFPALFALAGLLMLGVLLSSPLISRWGIPDKPIYMPTVDLGRRYRPTRPVRLQLAADLAIGVARGMRTVAPGIGVLLGVLFLLVVSFPARHPELEPIPLSPWQSLLHFAYGGLWIVAIAGCVGAALLPFGLRSVGRGSHGGWAIYSGELRRSWSTLPLSALQLRRAYYFGSVGVAAFLVCALLAWKAAPTPVTAPAVIAGMGLLKAIDAGFNVTLIIPFAAAAATAFTVGTPSQRRLAGALCLPAVAWRPLYALAETVALAYWDRQLPPPPDWLFDVVLGSVALVLAVVLLLTDNSGRLGGLRAARESGP